MRKTSRVFLDGEVINVSYPFVREEVHLQDEDGIGKSMSWRPGVVIEDRGDSCNNYTVLVAEGIGQQVLTVVATFKPGKYPKRVFFTRQWRDPSGHLFGKSALRVISISAFSGLLTGYRHRFELRKPAGSSLSGKDRT